MKGIVYDFASKKFLRRADVPIPTPKPGEVLVKVRCCALNPVDAKIDQWKGMIPAEHRDCGAFVPGLDVVGTVVGHGEGVALPEKGAVVLYHGRMLKPDGGLATFSCHDAATTVVVDEAWRALDDAALSAVPCAAWTAYKVVAQKCHVKKGDSVLIYGCSGGVGSFAAQFCRQRGAAQIIGVCSGSNAPHATKMGCSAVVDYKTCGSIPKRVMELTGGRGVDAAIDLVGPDTTAVCADCLAFDGVVCPVVSNADPSKTENQFGRGLVFAQVSLGAAHGADDRARQALAELGKEATDAIVVGGLAVPVTKVVTLEEAPRELEAMLEAHTKGKIVVRVETEAG